MLNDSVSVESGRKQDNKAVKCFQGGYYSISLLKRSDMICDRCPVEPPLAAVNTREWEIISDVSAVSDDPISHSSANNRITVIHIINHRLLKAECD